MRRYQAEVVSLYEPELPLPAPAAAVAAALEPFVSDHRKGRIETVIAGRTRRVIPVFERLDDPHNTAAVLRSCDAFGAHEVHVIADEERFVTSSRVAKGAERWLDLKRHETTPECVAALRSRGYKVLVAAMDGTHTPADLSALDGKVALVFGNEHRGVSDEMRALADGSYRIPMRGFVESLNVSVAAAITIHAATAGRESDLTDDERMELRARFYMLSVERSDEMVAALFPGQK